MRVARRALVLGTVGGAGLLLAACGGAAPPPPPAATKRPPTGVAAVATQATALQNRPALTLYSGRAKEMVEPLLNDFAQRYDAKVTVEYGESAELANSLIQAGGAARADLFFSQDAGPLGTVASAGLLAELPAQHLRRVEERFRSPRGEWLGLSGRARVIVYNTRQLAEAALPDTVEGLIDRRWQGALGWAPTNSSFQAFVTAMRVLEGEGRAQQWLVAGKANGARSYRTNLAIVEAVVNGEVLVGLVNHYYLYNLQSERGAQLPAAIYSPRGGGAGALMNVAGIGVLKNSQQREAALQLVEHLQSPAAQYHFISRTFEYGLIGGAEITRLPFTAIDMNVPRLDLNRLADVATTLTLLRSTGLVA